MTVRPGRRVRLTVVEATTVHAVVSAWRRYLDAGHLDLESAADLERDAEAAIMILNRAILATQEMPS